MAYPNDESGKKMTIFDTTQVLRGFPWPAALAVVLTIVLCAAAPRIIRACADYRRAGRMTRQSPCPRESAAGRHRRRGRNGGRWD